MRIQIIWLVLLAILATSDADRAMAQERIDTSNFSAAAKAELSDGAQATETESGEGMVTITVKGTNWGTGRPENIKSILENVAWHMTRHFRGRVYATIKVENSRLGPKILLRIPGQTTYTILLDTSDRHWAQYSYQFAHEFCHLVSNYEQQFGRPSQWIDETILRNGIPVRTAKHGGDVEGEAAIPELAELRAKSDGICGHASGGSRVASAGRRGVGGGGFGDTKREVGMSRTTAKGT